MSASAINEPSQTQISGVFHLLPKFAQEMSEIIGLEKTLRVVNALGGTSRPIPTGGSKTSAKPIKKLIDDLGCKETAETLIKVYGGQVIYLPICLSARQALRNNAIHKKADDALRAGHKMNRIVDDLSLEYRLSARSIWKILKKPPVTPNS